VSDRRALHEAVLKLADLRYEDSLAEYQSCIEEASHGEGVDREGLALGLGLLESQSQTVLSAIQECRTAAGLDRGQEGV
jgi:hypothetical protein